MTQGQTNQQEIDIQSKISVFLIALRKLGFSGRAIAKAVGIEESTVSRLINKRQAGSEQLMRSLANLLTTAIAKKKDGIKAQLVEMDALENEVASISPEQIQEKKRIADELAKKRKRKS